MKLFGYSCTNCRGEWTLGILSKITMMNRETRSPCSCQIVDAPDAENEAWFSKKLPSSTVHFNICSSYRNMTWLYVEIGNVKNTLVIGFGTMHTEMSFKYTLRFLQPKILQLNIFRMNHNWLRIIIIIHVFVRVEAPTHGGPLTETDRQTQADTQPWIPNEQRWELTLPDWEKALLD